MTTVGPTPGDPAELAALVALAQHEHRAGRLVEAADAYRKILALRPESAGVHGNLGHALMALGKLDEAAAHYRRAIDLDPNFAQAHSNLGRILWEQGKHDEAMAQIRNVIALRPDYAEARNNLGNMLLQQHKLDEAAYQYQRAVALKPNLFQAHNSLGDIFHQQDNLDEAVASYRRAITVKRDLAATHNSLAAALARQDKLDTAVAHCEIALALKPDLFQAHNNLGNIFRKQGKLDLAADQYRRALALKPDCAEALRNLGHTLKQQGKVPEAAARYEQSLALRPHDAEAQMGLATCHLVAGDYERGWPTFEARLRMPGIVPPPGLTRWTGQPLAGRSLLVLSEQGLGDTLQFLRFVRPLKELGARIVLAVQAPLGRLLASYPDVDELFVRGSAPELPRADYYLPIFSAPGALGTTLSTIPREVPYLAADPDLTTRWRGELAATDGFKIGIAWQGARDYLSDRWRSIPLAQFAPLASLPGVRLISLQKGFGSEQVAAVDFPLLDLSGRLDEEAGPFMDSAAVIRGLDLVVTSDTVIPHLAGALGAPVWVALPLAPDWRWLLARDDSPWYPTMRLFRQTALDQWQDVFERIAQAVQARRAEQA